MTIRKTKATLEAEHVEFLKLVALGKPALEIKEVLKLSNTQIKSHLLKAYDCGGLTREAWQPEYEVVCLKDLPESVKKMLKQMSAGEEQEEVGPLLVKVSTADNGVLLTPFLAQQGRPDSPEKQSAEVPLQFTQLPFVAERGE